MSRKAKRFKRKLRVPFEWFGIGIALCVIPWLPRRGLFRLCDFLSAVMYFFDHRGMRRALETLRIIRGTCTGLEGTFDFDPDEADYNPTRAERLVIRRSYRNSARSVGYAFWTCVRAKARCAATGEVDAPTKAFLAAHRPAITFFRRPMSVSPAPAFFAAKGKRPIIVAWSRPLKDGRYRCECLAAHAPEEARDIRGLT